MPASITLTLATSQAMTLAGSGIRSVKRNVGHSVTVHSSYTLSTMMHSGAVVVATAATADRGEIGLLRFSANS